MQVKLANIEKGYKSLFFFLKKIYINEILIPKYSLYYKYN